MTNHNHFEEITGPGSPPTVFPVHTASVPDQQEFISKEDNQLTGPSGTSGQIANTFQRRHTVFGSIGRHHWELNWYSGAGKFTPPSTRETT
jgi:hypothetical protein